MFYSTGPLAVIRKSNNELVTVKTLSQYGGIHKALQPVFTKALKDKFYVLFLRYKIDLKVNINCGIGQPTEGMTVKSFENSSPEINKLQLRQLHLKNDREKICEYHPRPHCYKAFYVRY